MSPGTDNLVRLTHLEATLREYGPHIYIRHFDLSSPERSSQYTEWRRETKRLGRGAFGEVYLETCVRGGIEGSVRAVKVFSKVGFSNAPTFDYGRELEAIARFSQPQYQHFFVSSTGWYESDDSIHLTMEYLEHGDLERYIGTGLPEREVQALIRQVMQGLVIMHRAGYAHRDLKPQNLLVVRKGPSWRIKLADFGLSKRVSDGLTSFRTLAGTPYFMAPELYEISMGNDDDSDSDEESQSYSNAVDIWAVGVILYLLMTGTVPFQDRRALKRYVKGKIPFPAEALEAKLDNKSGSELVTALLRPEASRRPSARESLNHEWLSATHTKSVHGRSDQTLLSINNTESSLASARWSSIDSGYLSSTRPDDLTRHETVTENVTVLRQNPSANDPDGRLDTVSTIESLRATPSPSREPRISTVLRSSSRIEVTVIATSDSERTMDSLCESASSSDNKLSACYLRAEKNQNHHILVKETATGNLIRRLGTKDMDYFGFFKSISFFRSTRILILLGTCNIIFFDSRTGNRLSTFYLPKKYEAEWGTFQGMKCSLTENTMDVLCSLRHKSYVVITLQIKVNDAELIEAQLVEEDHLEEDQQQEGRRRWWRRRQAKNENEIDR